MIQQAGDTVGKRCHICTGCGRCGENRMDTHVLVKMTQMMREKQEPQEAKPTANGNKACVGNRRKRLVIADIGTTTIAMQLYGTDGKLQDTFAVVNPQTAYGADVLSRIWAAENPANAGQMQQMVREVLSQGIAQFRGLIESGKKEEIPEEAADGEEPFQMIITANTTMVYLLMGYDTAELGRAPFRASHLQPIETVIAEVPCYIVQGLSAFVGGDIAAGIFACGMNESEENILLIDLGTNGEMVLGNRDKMIACSTAAGPAFEGGVNRGVWGADMVSLLARLRKEGILDGTGLLAEPYFDKGVRIGDVCVTQEAVRAVQLAKGAIVAGIRILVQEYGISMEQIDKVVLAGGFGYYLNPQAAAYIGLLPGELGKKTITGGNTALTGALMLGRKLIDGEGQELPDLFKAQKTKLQIINLAEIKTFHDIYFSSMDLN